MNRGSSRRLMDLPNRRVSVAVAIGATSLRSGHVLRGPLNLLHDVVVARAPAQIAFELVTDELFGGLGITLEQLVGGQDHTGCAEPALQAVLLPEALLDRVQLAVLREPLDGRDLRAVRLHREDRARLHGLTAQDRKSTR